MLAVVFIISREIEKKRECVCVCVWTRLTTLIGAYFKTNIVAYNWFSEMFTASKREMEKKESESENEKEG